MNKLSSNPQSSALPKKKNAGLLYPPTNPLTPFSFSFLLLLHPDRDLARYGKSLPPINLCIFEPQGPFTMILSDEYNLDGTVSLKGWSPYP